MPMFRVTLRRVLDKPSGNPFLRKIGPNATVSVTYREWKFEARNEQHVRELYQEAIDLGVAAVQGYELSAIHRLPRGSD